MIEIRKNQTLQLETREGIIAEGIIFDYDKDRVSVLISFDSIEKAKSFKELDILLARVKTHIGEKLMFSHVIDELNYENRLTIENAECFQTVQRREFVRVDSNVNFKVIKNGIKEVNCFCSNISGGGIAFACHNEEFDIRECIEIVFPTEEFGQEISCFASIIKKENSSYVALYQNLTPAIQEKIIKYVFKLVAKK